MSAAEGFEEFVAVVDRGTITAAADSLGLPRPTLSRRLARLEERLGVRLLHRTTRRITLTRAGEGLYTTARRVVETAREAERATRQLAGGPRGLLRVSLPPEIPQAMLGSWVVDFLLAWPDVRVDVVGTSAHLDLVASGVDVAMWSGPVHDPGLVVRTLAIDRLVAVAAPAYLARAGTPRSATELQDHACLLAHDSRGVPVTHWPLWNGGRVPVQGPAASNLAGVQIETARAGLGIALLVDRGVRRDVESGRLCPVLPDLVGAEHRLSIVYPDRRLLDPKVRVFIDHIVGCIDRARAARFADPA